jgi:polysaccharide biosynthesis/export protein
LAAVISRIKEMNSFRDIAAILRGLSLAVAGAMLIACSGGGGSSATLQNNFVSTDTATPTGNKISGKGAAAAAKIFAANSSPSGSTNVSDYRISSLDVLQISVLGLKDMDTTVQVGSTGMISLPLVRTIKAGGRTTAELEQAIAQKLQATYLQSPQVTVFIKEYNSQRVTVDGAVVKPGIFPINGTMSLLQSIALAQGLDRVADPSAVLIFRQVNGQRMAARFDVKQIRLGKMADPSLLAGDIVMVDQSAVRTTLRDVNESIGLSGLFRLF